MIEMRNVELVANGKSFAKVESIVYGDGFQMANTVSQPAPKPLEPRSVRRGREARHKRVEKKRLRQEFKHA